MSDVHSQENRKAKKEHKCDGCRQPITVGTRYSYQSGKRDGDWYSYRYHLGCQWLVWTAEKLWGAGEGWCDPIEDYDYLIQEEPLKIPKLLAVSGLSAEERERVLEILETLGVQS